MLRAHVVAIGLILAVSACATSGSPSPPSSQPGSEPSVSVIRFLEASNAGDLEAMARIFGTSRGAVADRTGNTLTCAVRRVGSWIRLGDPCVPWSEIELRMNTIAIILEHEEYQLRSESTVAGRTRPTTRVGVDLETTAERIVDVPFVTVLGPGGAWYLEEIGLERITNPR